MRAQEFISEALLVTDVPNEDWLESKRAWAEKKGHDSFDSPYFGVTTGYVRQPSYVELPVDILKRIPGARLEQANVRHDDLKAIMKIMKDTGELPLHNGRPYLPFIGVAWNGEARVLEGNHRIMAAAALGWKTLPVELKYFDGGERVKSGPLYPGKIGLQEPKPGTSVVMNEDYDPNARPPGPETKPTMPRGTVRVDVSDVYDWYKLGMHIADLKRLGKHDFGKGPPSTIFSFGDEETEHEYIKDLEKTGLTTTDIDPLDPKQPRGMKRQKTDPTFNVGEARANPEQNVKADSGMKELEAVAKTIDDPENWAVSMTGEPKLGINPQAGISEDTPKGIYFYPLNYVLGKIHRRKPLPWGDNMPYIQLFQYDRSNQMTQETEVNPAKLRQALSQYCSPEIMQQAEEEDEYDGTPYWFIYDCLSRLGKSDETNVIRWNKVLRDLGFTSVFDPGRGWIAHNEPTQGVVLDPRIIKQHKTILNRKESTVVTTALIAQLLFDEIDMELASNRMWQKYDPDGSKLRQAVKKYATDPKFKPFIGKPGSQELEDKIKGYRLYGANQLKDIANEWYKAQQAKTEDVAENFADGKKPGRKGLAKRMNVPTKASISTLRKIAKNSTGEKARMAHWLANMKAGRKK